MIQIQYKCNTNITQIQYKHNCSTGHQRKQRRDKRERFVYYCFIAQLVTKYYHCSTWHQREQRRDKRDRFLYHCSTEDWVQSATTAPLGTREEREQAREKENLAASASKTLAKALRSWSGVCMHSKWSGVCMYSLSLHKSANGNSNGNVGLVGGFLHPGPRKLKALGW